MQPSAAAAVAPVPQGSLQRPQGSQPRQVVLSMHMAGCGAPTRCMCWVGGDDGGEGQRAANCIILMYNMGLGFRVKPKP